MLKAMWESLCKEASKSTASILRENILFQDLTSKELKLVLGTVHVRSYRENETVFHQGQAGFGMYIIESGAVDISLKNETHTDNVDETTLAILTSGDFFGELALVEEGGKRSASARATSETKLIGFFKPDLFDIIQRSPSTGVKIALRLNEVLGKRLIETNHSVTTLSKQLRTLQNGAKQ